ncbi:hypothetical protein ACQKOF_05115 [Lysinibacillus sp. NPDC093190]|uniref:hypothetical protein n=1 Tax=Lysinibacillus sp. NPDC093190 TaxID=3390575 RepID=UPI003D05A3A4
MKKYLFSLLLFIIAVIASVWSYPQLPESIISTSKYQSDSTATPREFLVSMIPVMMILVLVCMALIQKLGLNKKSPRSVEPVNAILNGIILILLPVHGLVLAYGMGIPFNVDIIAPLVTGAVFIVIGNFIPRVRGNLGSSLAASVYDTDNGIEIRKSHLFMGRVYVASGFIMLVSTLVPGGASLPVFITLLLLTVIISIIGYYKLLRG